MSDQSDPADGRITTELSDGLFLIGIDRPSKSRDAYREKPATIP